jgi:HEAT repeat protein
MRGQNLAPWLLTHQESLPQRAIWSEIGKKKMVVYGDHKLICDLGDDSCQVFDLLHDPQERKNLVDSDPRRALELRGRLQALLQESRQYEQAAQGKPPQLSATDSAAQAALASARLGDRSALPALLQLIGEGRTDEQMQHDAVRLAALLSTQAVSVRASETDPLTAMDSAVVRTATDALSQRFLSQGTLEQRRWAAALLTRLGEDTPDSAALLQELIADEQAPPSQRLAAALAQWRIASCRSRQKQDCVADSLRVLDAAMSIDDPDQVRPLLRLLGESHDGRALAPLVRQLTVVRSRVDVVEALGQLGDRRAIPALGETLLSDPYVHVRSAAVLALRKLGGPETHTLLQRAQKSEREPAVQAVLGSVDPSAESPLPTHSGASK